MTMPAIAHRISVAAPAASRAGSGKRARLVQRSIIQCHAVCATSADSRIVPMRSATT